MKERKVEFTFINSTPWWGGNEFGYTFDDEGNVTIPSANEIVGKTRWLMRNIIAQILGQNSFKGIDDKFLKDLGTLESKSKITVRVTKLEGDVSPPYYFTKEKASYVKKKANYVFNKIATGLPSLIGKNVNKLSENRVWSRLSPDLQEYFKYFLIPRFNLAHMGKNNAMYYYYNQPAKPKSVRVKVEIINNGADEDFFNFFISSLIFTMKYIGLGRASTRGFGRFILERDNRSFEDDFKDLLLLGRVIVSQHRFVSNELFPCDIPIVRIDYPYAYFFSDEDYVPILNKDPITYLIAIGNATLKIAWKKAIGRGYKDHGDKYHTWTLGLPRGLYKKTKKTGYFVKNNDQGRRISYITISPICNGETCDKIYLIPFIYEEEEAKKITHRGKYGSNNKAIKELPVQDVLKRVDKPNHEQYSVRYYIDVTLRWLKYILCGGACDE